MMGYKLSGLLDDKKHKILKTIWNSKELHRGAFEQLEKA